MQWHFKSTTCPQCRAICTARNIRRLYFNSSVNNSSSVDVPISTNPQMLAKGNLHLTQIDETISESKETLIRKNQEMVKLSETHLSCLERIRQFEVRKLNRATAEINNLKMEHRRLSNVEKKLKENTKELHEMDGAKNFINSSASEVEALLNETPESLAKMVVMLKGQLINKEMKRNEVLNTLKVCRAENVKLDVNKRQLREKFDSLQTNNNKEI